jgi:hypothetical protein
MALPPGGVPEWPKGTGCKPVGSAFRGSNPLSPTFRMPRFWNGRQQRNDALEWLSALLAQLVEHLHGKRAGVGTLGDDRGSFEPFRRKGKRRFPCVPRLYSPMTHQSSLRLTSGLSRRRSRGPGCAPTGAKKDASRYPYQPIKTTGTRRAEAGGRGSRATKPSSRRTCAPSA